MGQDWQVCEIDLIARALHFMNGSGLHLNGGKDPVQPVPHDLPVILGFRGEAQCETYPVAVRHEVSDDGNGASLDGREMNGCALLLPSHLLENRGNPVLR